MNLAAIIRINDTNAIGGNNAVLDAKPAAGGNDGDNIIALGGDGNAGRKDITLAGKKGDSLPSSNAARRSTAADPSVA